MKSNYTLRVHPYGPADNIPICSIKDCLNILLPGEKNCPRHNKPCDEQLEPADWEKKLSEVLDNVHFLHGVPVAVPLKERREIFHIMFREITKAKKEGAKEEREIIRQIIREEKDVEIMLKRLFSKLT